MWPLRTNQVIWMNFQRTYVTLWFVLSHDAPLKSIRFLTFQTCKGDVIFELQISYFSKIWIFAPKPMFRVSQQLLNQKFSWKSQIRIKIFFVKIFRQIEGLECKQTFTNFVIFSRKSSKAVKSEFLIFVIFVEKKSSNWSKICSA